MKKISSLLIFGIIVVIAVGSYAGYLLLDNASKGENLQELNTSLVEYKKQDLKERNQEVLQAITAKQAVDGLETDLIEWSEVMKEIRKTMPKKNGDVLVDILSYSGNDNSEITMSVKTLALSFTPYMDVAELIESFDDSEYFSNVFVPSISSGTNSEGREILTFLLSANYSEPTSAESKSVQR